MGFSDIRDFDKYEEVAMVVDAATEGQGLNLLINNAGVTSKVAKITAIRKSELTDNFETNTIAPILLTKVRMSCSHLTEIKYELN